MKLRDLPTAEVIDDSEELKMVAMQLIDVLLEIEADEIMKDGGKRPGSRATKALDMEY